MCRKLSALTLSAVLSIGLSQFAAAADLPVKAPIVEAPVVAPYNWTGFYIGGNGGYAWGDSDVSSTFSCITGAGCTYSIPANHAAVSSAATGSLSSDGFIGGGQIGYNWQVANVVYGIETDFNAFDLSSSLSATGPFPQAVSNYAVTVSVKTNWLYTLRARLGYTITPTTLLYATGGLAVADIEVSNAFTDIFTPTTFGSSSSTKNKAGWIVGGGLEWAFNRNWTIKGEYLYVDFGSVSTTLNTNAPFGFLPNANAMTTSADLHASIVRAGINYRF